MEGQSGSPSKPKLLEQVQDVIGRKQQVAGVGDPGYRMTASERNGRGGNLRISHASDERRECIGDRTKR